MTSLAETRSPALPVNKILLGGILSGWIGGSAFGMMMGMMGMLPMIGKMVGVPSAVVGFFVHMVISAIIGIGFAVVFGKVAQVPSISWMWGLLYGVIWWILGGPLQQLRMRYPVSWGISSMEFLLESPMHSSPEGYKSGKSSVNQ
jgi:hypothetical protein